MCGVSLSVWREYRCDVGFAMVMLGGGVSSVNNCDMTCGAEQKVAFSYVFVVAMHMPAFAGGRWSIAQGPFRPHHICLPYSRYFSTGTGTGWVAKGLSTSLTTLFIFGCPNESTFRGRQGLLPCWASAGLLAGALQKSSSTPPTRTARMGTILSPKVQRLI